MESAANPSNVNLSNQEGENVLVGDVSREQENVVQAAKTELNVESPNHEGNEHAKGLKLALIALALCLGVFLVALGMFIFSLSFKPSEVGDNCIIATAIPKITDQFHSLDDVGWYGSGTLNHEATSAMDVN
ncbi:hypothetical protein PCG10_005168 [Penicillium crustosum]|uniref:Uncharacterized protein n=1 Tax=Penicillium crustosum TaxID=36656 RepID=A0A9P5GQM4_PENCR|nr:hypothetical protein PCG10_005168 [Penicillium crustosum]